MNRRSLAAGVIIVCMWGTSAVAEPKQTPNIILILADNLGYGELSCYNSVRMVPTPRIDALARQGLRLTNFNTEAWRGPSRSALLTGRYGIRSGTDRVKPGEQGMVGWEVTLAELLSERGYATAFYGKWYLGDKDGRFPIDQGFDEWYGVTYNYRNEPSMTTPVSETDTTSCIFAGKKGEKARREGCFNAKTGGQLDRDLADRSVAFIERNAKDHHPFFLYVPIAAVHAPVFCHPEFAGKSGAGPVGDAMLGMDSDVGRLIDAVTRAGIGDDTIFIFTSDDGPEAQEGTAGPWSGNCNTAMEGSLRAPCIVRWPGHIPAGRVSNEIVHITDLFTTLALAGGASIPTDRVIDGVDQMDFFTEKQETSNREGFPIFVSGKIYAVKWQDWKMHFIWWPSEDQSPRNTKHLFNLRSDPREQYNVIGKNQQVLEPIKHIVADFQASLAKDPLIQPGTPDPYQPAKN